MPSIQRTTGLITLLLTFASHAAAQRAPGVPWVQHVVRSTKLGKRTIYVVTPDGYEQNSARYPVLVMLDADHDLQFRLGIAQVAYMADNGPAIPPVIVVGIVNGADRLHDMTPPATGTSVAEFKTAGGASAFADYIVAEVLPFIRSRYRTLPTTILAAHSAGGLFALDVAAKRPGVFQGIIAISPALWFNDSSLVGTYADAIAKSHAQLRLFAASGGLEPDIDITTRRFAQRLDFLKPANVAFAYTGYPNDTHSLTPLSGLADGLRFVFEPISGRQLPISNLRPDADSAAVVRALSASESMYAAGARSLLFPEQLPEKAVNRLGYAMLGKSKTALAIWVFERNVRLYPKSVNVYDSLADGYLALGDTTAAIAQLRKAADVGRVTGQRVSSETLAKLMKIESKKPSLRPSSASTPP